MSADIRLATHTNRGLLHFRTALMLFFYMYICNQTAYLEVIQENCCELMHTYFVRSVFVL